jgi:hypothetical protein
MHAKALRLGKLKHHSGMSFQTEGDGRTRRWKLVVAALLVVSDVLLALVMWLPSFVLQTAFGRIPLLEVPLVSIVPRWCCGWAGAHTSGSTALAIG